MAKDNVVKLDELPNPPLPPEPDHLTVLQRQQAFGYTNEELNSHRPKATDVMKQSGSMGSDTPIACSPSGPSCSTTISSSCFRPDN